MLNISKVLQEKVDAKLRQMQLDPEKGTVFSEDAAGNKKFTEPTNQSLLDLTDTPASYTGEAGKALIVKLAEDGIEFGAAGASLPEPLGEIDTATHKGIGVFTDWPTNNFGNMVALIGKKDTLNSVYLEDSQADFEPGELEDVVAAASGLELAAGAEIFVQRGSVSWYAETSEEITLDTPVAVGKSFPLVTWRANADFLGGRMVRADLTTVVDDKYTKIRFRRGNANITSTIEWQVSESEDFTVQSGEKSGHGTQAISSVDVDKAFIVVSNTPDGSNSAWPYRALTRAKFNSNTEIEIACQNTDNPNATCWYVVEWKGATVQSKIIDVGSGLSSNTATITEVDLDKTFILFSNYASSSGGNSDRAFPRVRFSDSTTVEVVRSSTTDALSASCFIISHSGITVQSGIGNTGTGQITDSITAVDLEASFMPASCVGNAYTTATSRMDAGVNTHKLTATDAIAIDRYNTGGDLYASWFVVSGGSGGNHGNRIALPQDLTTLSTDPGLEIRWTTTTPTGTTVSLETAVKGETAYTDENIGTGDGVKDTFYLPAYPAERHDDLVIKIDAVATTNFTRPGQKFTLYLGGATGGTFTLGDGITNTSALNYNDSAATIETALEGIYGSGKVTVTAGTDFTVAFDAGVRVSDLEADFTNLTGATDPALTATETNYYPKKIVFDSGSEPGNTLVVTATYTGVTNPSETAEVQTLYLGGATGGTFTLSDGTTTTADIAYDASAADIETELEAIYGTDLVTVAAATDFTITFSVRIRASGLVADFALLTGATSPTLTETTAYSAGDWAYQTTATAITNIPAGDLTGQHLWIRQTLETDDPAETPTLTEAEVYYGTLEYNVFTTAGTVGTL